MDISIEFNNVNKSFNNTKVLKNIDLKIYTGELVVIVGTSGCGKTTLLKLINGIHSCDSGSILLQGNDINSQNKISLRREIGYVLQQTGLFPHMTVFDNIACVPKILKWDKNKISTTIDNLLHLVDLPPEVYKTRYPSELSGGQQQRVGIARALAANPNILLMDEPFASIDAITRNELQKELLLIHENTKKTIIFVSHDISEAVKLGDRIIVMDKGEIVQIDTPYNIVHKPKTPFVRKLVSTFDSLNKLFDSIEISDVS